MTKFADYGINRHAVSAVVYRKGRRIGEHPFKVRLRNRKVWFFPVKVYSIWVPPAIRVYGLDGGRILDIECATNDIAKELRDRLIKDMPE